MVMRLCTGPETAHAADGEFKGKNGGPSPNSREIVRMIAGDDPAARMGALQRLINTPMALAYLAATAQHEDVRGAARKEMLSRWQEILCGMAGRTLEPWEKEVVRLAREALKDYSGWDKALIDAKLTQIELGKSFNAYDSTGGVEFVDESAPEFDEGTLARTLGSSGL